MLSSKQTHRSPKEMAPEQIGFLNKMRKSLSGKHYNRNSGDFSQPMTIPIMDPDTAIAYIRDSSFDKTRLVSCTPSVTSNNGHDKGMDSGQTLVTNGSVHMNGKLPNGTHITMSENANDIDSESEQPEVSIFEMQGARPKIRKNSKEGETDNAFDESASTEIQTVSPEWIHGMQSTTEPPCVEMAQPHFPALKTNCNDGCSIVRKGPQPYSVGTSPGGRRPDSEIPIQTPSSSPGTIEPTIPLDSVSDPPSHSDHALSTSRAHMTETPNCRTEIPKSTYTNTQLKSERNYKEIESNVSSDPHQSSIERVAALAEPHNVERVTRITSPSTRSSAQVGASYTDMEYSRPSDANHELLTHQESPTTHQSKSLSFDKKASTIEEENEENLDAAETCNKQSDIAANDNTVEVKNSKAKEFDIIDKTMQETIMDCVRAALVETLSKQACEMQTCTPVRHCCTCTCEKSNTKATMLPDSPHKQCDNSLKSSLTLVDIPQNTHSSSEGSPKLPRTPHIAMLINSNDLFSDGDTKSKSLPQHDLNMMMKFNAFSLHPVCPDNQEAHVTENKEGLQEPNESYYSETRNAFGAVSISQEADGIPDEKEPHHGSADDSQCVQGATGGSDITSARSKAPLIDRSSKPKEFNEATCEDSNIEEPPPLPPRLPVPPPVAKHNPFTAYPIFDDEDDDFPTHEFLHEINMDAYIDPSTTIKSKSLPRNATPDEQASPPELRAAKRGKTVNMKNRFSQIFKPGSKKKRHSTHGFPDRPLPDIPLNPRLPKPSADTRQNNPSLNLFGTATGEIVSQQAVKEGLLKENPSKEEVDKAREQFAISLRKISEYGWYWGPMSWDDAESRLENMPDGSFLVRDSSDDRHLLSLSFRAQGSTHHTRVEHHNGKFSFWSQPCSHGSASIVEFVEEAMRHSHSGRVLYFLRPRMPGYPPAAVQLLYPISRFQKSRSLQHMCRFVIRKHVRLDHIDSLPLPRRLKDYLNEAQYYTQDDILH